MDIRKRWRLARGGGWQEVVREHKKIIKVNSENIYQQRDQSLIIMIIMTLIFR